MFVEFSHMEKKDFPRVTLVFEDGKWVGANKMTLAASSYLCAAAWQKKASAPTDLYEGNSEQYFGGIPPPGIMLNARNFSATYYTSREVCTMDVTASMMTRTTFVLSASCTKMSDTNSQGSLHQRDLILVAKHHS